MATLPYVSDAVATHWTPRGRVHSVRVALHALPRLMGHYYVSSIEIDMVGIIQTQVMYLFYYY